MLNVEECSCEKCVEACQRNPGWFGTIREIKGAAKIMNLSEKDFANEYLIREWWTGTEDIFVPAPRRNFKKCQDDAYKAWFGGDEDAAERNGKGFVKASWGHNLMTGFACIFLTENNRCIIHDSKPKECREIFCCKNDNFKGRKKLVSYWKKHQDYINSLMD